MSIAFFGCWDENHIGHFLYNDYGKTLPHFGPFISESLDGVLLRCGHRIPGQVDLTCFKEHTVISFIDQTADKRPGSNASFIVEGYGLTKRQCWEAARKVFPQIVERVKNTTRQED